MRRIATAIAALAAVGCAEKAVELKLQLLDDPEFDVSCVNTVQVILHDGSPDFFNLPTQCVAVDGATSFADIESQIRGQFSIAMPDEMIAIELRALASTTPELCGTGVNIFYAGQEFVGQDQISLRIRPTLSCDAMQTADTRTVRPVDFFALAGTAPGAEPTCSLPAGFIELAEGTIRPTSITLPDFPSSLVELGVFTELQPTGTGILPAWSSARGSSCLAVSAPEIGSASCIYPGAKTVCAPIGEVEVPIVRGAATFESVDPDIYDEYSVIIYGAVWDTSVTPKAPVAGATITLPENTGRIVYGRNVPGASRVEPISGAATDAGGMFLAYLKEPTLATVTGGGTTKQIMLGGSFAWGSAVIVPLR